MSVTSIHVDSKAENTRVSASFLFPWSFSLLGPKIPLRRRESAHENIMSKHSSTEMPGRPRTRGFGAAQSYHTLQSKAPYPWRGLPLLSPLNTAAASSPSCPPPHPPSNLPVKGLWPVPRQSA